MADRDGHSTGIDPASKSLPAFLFGGCIGGLLLGVIFDNIPYGVAGGLLLALFSWFLLVGKRAGARAPDPGADA